MQKSSHKTLALLTRRQLLSEQVSLIVMSVDIACSPFVPISALPYHVIGNTLTLIIQSRVGDNIICQDRLVGIKDICWALHSDTHHPELVSESSEVFATLLHCNEFTAEQRALHTSLILRKTAYMHTIKYDLNPVLDILVAVSEAWSVSIFALTIKPSPRGWGMLGGCSSFPCTCPNSLEVQSFWSKVNSYRTGFLGHTTSLHCDTSSNTQTYEIPGVNAPLVGGLSGRTSWSTRGIYPLVQFQPSTSSCLSETFSTTLH